MIVFIIYFETLNCFDKVHYLYQSVGDVFGDLLQRPKEEVGVPLVAPLLFGLHIHGKFSGV